MVEGGGQGRVERAASLGWTDVYTFTKALGESAVVEASADIRVSIVRPAVVESSWKHPFPGWIEGFKMAEPLILAYGRGELPDFPASPDSVIDVVPCDYVVNAIVAVCATTPGWEPASTTSAPGPGTRDLPRHVLPIRNYFLVHPLSAPTKRAGRLPSGSSPPRLGGAAAVGLGERCYRLADAVVTRVPRSERTREFARDIDRRMRRLTFVRRYQSLYNEYSQSELHFVDDHTLALTQALHPDDQDAFAFDTAVFDWKTYIEEVHCPSVTASMRKMDALRSKSGSRPTTMKDLRRTRPGPGDRRLRQTANHVDQVVEQYFGPGCRAPRRSTSWPRSPGDRGCPLPAREQQTGQLHPRGRRR